MRLSKRFEVVGEAGTGREALAVVAEHDPDLLLLDVSMPDMDGLDALVRVRESAPRTQVVMFSGFEEHGLADRARVLGAADFIEKSVSLEELTNRLLAVVADPGGAPSADAPHSDPAPVSDPVLQEHLERFRDAFDQAAIGMATLTLTGRIVRGNGNFEALVGVGPGALVGIPYEDLSEAPSDELVALIREVASGAQDAVSAEHRLANGPAVVSTMAVVRDSARTPLYLFLQVQDVSARRAAEEELRRSEERFRLLVEGVQDYAIFMLDPSGHIVSWNAGAQRAKGYTAEEILGQHFSVFYLPDAVASGHPDYELEVAIAEGRYEEEGWRIRKDGTTFWANVVITAIYDRNGVHIGFAKVTRDSTERRQLLQDLEHSAAERTQLLAVTAHELRTPVSVVNGFVSTLEEHWDELDDEERRQMIRSIGRSGARLSRLVDDLFTAARLESGALEVRSTEFDLAALANEVVGELGTEGVEVVGETVMIAADRGRVQQMISNYLTNAVHYGATPIRVLVSAVAGSAQLVVTDSGPGVSDPLVPRLFHKFASGGSREATGLGLFIVRELARAQGGDAWYEPSEGGGAAFGISLPLGG